MKVLPRQLPAREATPGAPVLQRAELPRLDAPRKDEAQPATGPVGDHLARVRATLVEKSTPGSLAAVAEATAAATAAAVEGLLGAIGAFTGESASVDALRRLVARTDATLKQLERAHAQAVHLRPEARRAVDALGVEAERALAKGWPALSAAIDQLAAASPKDAAAIGRLKGAIAAKLGALEAPAKTSDAVPPALKAAAAALESRGIPYEVVTITALGEGVPGLKLLGSDAKGLGKLAGSVKAKLGVDLVYSPAALKQAGSPLGCYVDAHKLVLIDEATLLANRPTYVALHELRHAWYSARAERGEGSLHHVQFKAHGFYKLGATDNSYAKYMSAEELGTWVKMMAHQLPTALRALGDGKRPLELDNSPLPIIDTTSNMAKRTQVRLDALLALTRTGPFLDAIEDQHAVRLVGDGLNLRWLGYEATVELSGPAAKAAKAEVERATAALTEARKKLPKLLRYVSPEIQAKRADLAAAYRKLIGVASERLGALESSSHAMRDLLAPAFERLELLKQLDQLTYYTPAGQQLILERAAKYPELAAHVDPKQLGDATTTRAMATTLRTHLIEALKVELPRAVERASVAVGERDRIR